MTTGGILGLELAGMHRGTTGGILGLELVGIPRGDMRRRWRKEEADLTLKSNNPNLKGGEKLFFNIRGKSSRKFPPGCRV